MNSWDQTKILNLARNFMESRLLLTGAELDLFTLLTPKPLSAQEISTRLQAGPRGVMILLDALSAMGLLTKREGTYECPPAISALLSSDAPESILPWVLHMAAVWKRWALLTDIVRGSQPPGLQVSPLQKMNEVRAFIGAMHMIAAPLAPRIVAAVQPSSSRALLDVGGAMGTYTVAFLQAVPEMRATLFDRPDVIKMARPFLKGVGLIHRVTFAAGDFYQDEFPKGHDLAFVSAIIHQNSPEQNLNLFHKAFRSLDSGGRIIIRDHVMNPNRTRPVDGAIFAVNMLVATTGGNTYTLDEIRAGLTQAGFVNVRLLQPGEHMDALVEATKP